jgi:hypothetical protein
VSFDTNTLFRCADDILPSVLSRVNRNPATRKSNGDSNRIGSCTGAPTLHRKPRRESPGLLSRDSSGRSAAASDCPFSFSPVASDLEPPLASETPFDSPALLRDTGDMAVAMTVKFPRPRDEGKAEAVVDHS